MSVFLAVDLDDPTRTLAASLIETHRAMWPKAKWLRTDKLHCTLVFLGHPSADQLTHWAPAIDALASRHQPFSLRLSGAGTFSTARAPSVLWLGISGMLAPLAELQRDTEATFGLQAKEAFIPHVTLARAQVAGTFETLVTDLKAFTSNDFEIRGLSLYESTSEVYRVIHAAPLSHHGSSGR
ncbi:MAG: RNA 2',3'-cyclic phosphodiesterase [Archangium sp.]|nr:RNA 2',3'-cyclic phosphodiesterase [Archangium sp.]MDP3574271.1 RNA 2',3'-cyclic phosphodiesterase [Archangium sp.]